MARETTLILFKPDAVSKNLTGTVLARFQEPGFVIRGIKMLRFDKALLDEHYSELTEFPFYPLLEEFMLSGPVIALALEGEDVIKTIRAMIGPTDSTKAPKGTIRGDFGECNRINMCHASDGPESAAVEIKRFFSEDELFDY
ncbi:MAG: nucleoside-diphosphate kinase [Verrucomicrobiales bacterium]|nr:nucleoside-diphosphate kinase [Verrucomicrobiota bacterium JB025]